MALTLRGESSTSSNTTGLSLTTPAGTQVGDLLVLIHADDFYTLAGLTTPTGGAATTWTLQHSYDGGTNAGHCKVWTAPATASGANTVTPNSTNTDQERYGQLFTIAAAAFDVASSSTQASATSFVCPSVSATGTDDILITTVGLYPAAGDITIVAGMTACTEQDVGGSATYRSAYEQLSASGATGTRTHTETLSNSRAGFVLSLAIKASGGASTPNPRQPIVESTTLPPPRLTAGAIVQTNSVRFSNAADAAARQVPRLPVTVVTAAPAKQRLVGGTITPQRTPVPQVAYQGGSSSIGLAAAGSQVGSVLPTARVVVATAQPARQRLTGGITPALRTAQPPSTPTSAELGSAALGLAATSVQAKTAVEVGTAAGGLAATGTAVKVVACGGSAGLGLAGTGAARRVAPQAGSSALGGAATGVEKKVAPQAGPGAFGLAITGAAARKQAQAGIAALGLMARHSGTVARALLGTAALGLSATGVETKTAVVAGVCALGAAARGGALAKTVTESGAGGLGATGRGVPAKTVAGSGLAVVGAATTGAEARIAAQRGASAVGLSGNSNTVFVLTFTPRAGTITDLAQRYRGEMPSDQAERHLVEAVADQATRYHTGTPV